MRGDPKERRFFVYLDLFLFSMLLLVMAGNFVLLQQTGYFEGAAALTPRQRQICELAAAGKGNRAIAQQLFLSVKTVESYQAHIKEKLSLKNGRELVQHAIQWTVSEKKTA